MFQVKICGVTSREDAIAAVGVGADALGFNFYEPSPRFVEPDHARRIVESLPNDVTKVGVFVNAEPQWVNEIVETVKLDVVQLHGDESPRVVAQLLSPRPIIRAFRPATHQLAEVSDFIVQCRKLGRIPQAVLLDAQHEGQYGGTGKTLDWDWIRFERGVLGDLPLVLAGGLTPANVERAIHSARPDAVDTASGVESAPGIKDATLMKMFVQIARTAFGAHH